MVVAHLPEATTVEVVQVGVQGWAQALRDQVSVVVEVSVVVHLVALVVVVVVVVVGDCLRPFMLYRKKSSRELICYSSKQMYGVL